MNFQNISVIHVYYLRGSEKLQMGRLALKDRKIFFEYHSDFLKTGLELSPFKLPLKSGVVVSEDSLFDGLFGVFNDSLPDGWGRLLLDRKLMKSRINPGELSPLDRLCYVGSHGMGALSYQPEIEDIHSHHYYDLDEIAAETMQFQENEGDRYIDDLLSLNHSSAGARPKIVVNMDGEDWIIKFRSLLDVKDSGPIEYAYHLMAKESHLDVPEAKLFPSLKGAGYFGVQRFDCVNGKRLHMHSVSGLLHVDHRVPSLDYETILKVTLWLTKDMRECEKRFRATVFNVLSHNRDDHAKNFSFLMDETGTWHVSPAYDLIFSSGPAAEHCTMIMGEGKNVGITHLLKLAEVVGIKKQKALQIINEIKGIVSKWQIFAKDAGVSKTSANMIQIALNRIIQNF